MGYSAITCFQTSRASISRETTEPQFNSRYSSRSNSRAVSSNFLPPRVAVRASNSTIKSAIRNDEGAAGRLRRIRARIRASNSAKRKRLYQVVVRSRVQAEHSIFNGIPRSENQNRNIETSSSHISQYFQTAAAGKHHVEQNQVEVKTAYRRKRIFAAGRKGNRVALPLQPLSNCLRQLAFVFNQ